MPDPQATHDDAGAFVTSSLHIDAKQNFLGIMEPRHTLSARSWFNCHEECWYLLERYFAGHDRSIDVPLLAKIAMSLPDASRVPNWGHGYGGDREIVVDHLDTKRSCPFDEDEESLLKRLKDPLRTFGSFEICLSESTDALYRYKMRKWGRLREPGLSTTALSFLQVQGLDTAIEESSLQISAQVRTGWRASRRILLGRIVLT